MAFVAYLVRYRKANRAWKTFGPVSAAPAPDEHSSQRQIDSQAQPTARCKYLQFHDMLAQGVVTCTVKSLKPLSLYIPQSTLRTIRFKIMPKIDRPDR